MDFSSSQPASDEYPLSNCPLFHGSFAESTVWRRDVPRSDGARCKKQVWRPHVETYVFWE